MMKVQKMKKFKVITKHPLLLIVLIAGVLILDVAPVCNHDKC